MLPRLRIPLTIDEAIAWLQRGGHVELLCDAMPWLVEPEPDNAFAARALDRRGERLAARPHHDHAHRDPCRTVP